MIIARRRKTRTLGSQILVYLLTLLLVFGAAAGVIWYAVHNELLDVQWLFGSSSSSRGQPPKVQQQLPSAYSSGDGTFDEMFGGTVFVGDSLTVGMSAYGYLASYQTFAKTGLTIDQAQTAKIDTDYGKMTIPAAVELVKPARVYVMLGTNGVSVVDTDVMLAQYTELLDMLEASSPDSEFCVLSISPVAVNNGYKIKNEDVRAYNEALYTLAAEREYAFIDVHAALADESGILPKEKTSDGIHWEKEVYPDVLGYIFENTSDK